MCLLAITRTPHRAHHHLRLMCNAYPREWSSKTPWSHDPNEKIQVLKELHFWSSERRAFGHELEDPHWRLRLPNGTLALRSVSEESLKKYYGSV